MKIRDFLPFQAPAEKTAKQILPAVDQKALSKTFKIAALAIGLNGLPSSLRSRATFETPEQDFSRIGQAIDTDSYVRQAVNKYKELMWKEGWEIVSENEEAINYLYERIEYMEHAMGMPFHDFLVSIGDQLVRYANVFIVKSRGDINPFFPDDLEGQLGRNPLNGYYLIPTEQVEIQRDQFNRPKWYRQRVEDSFSYYNGNEKDSSPKWNAKDVIHLHFDKKLGMAFGMPFLATALDDVLGLRQMEEDFQNLFHRELFPLYQYKIGTDDHPATKDEIENAEAELNSLRTEGGLIMPHRHTVEVIGADGSVLDGNPYITHMKERVAIALGLFPHHLGMSGSSANRSMTDRLDTALYDKIKTYQRYLADNIRHHIFNEILMEGGFDPHIHPAKSGDSARCVFRFREIDVDTQVKKETHELQKLTAGATTVPEARLALGLSLALDETETLAAHQARMTPPAVMQPKPSTPGGAQPAPKVIDVTPKPAQKALPAGSDKSVGNKVRPANQYGSRTSPNIRRGLFDSDWLEEVESLLDDNDEGMV